MKRPLLVTIGVSHYCEKARWALDRAGIAYDEEAHAPIVHFAFTLPRTRTRTVPILLTADEKLTDSKDILHYCDRSTPEHARLYPTGGRERDEVASLVPLFDDELGPATRRLAYAFLVDEPELFRVMATSRVTGVEAALFRRFSGGFRGAMRRAFRIREGVADRMFDKVSAVFDEASKRLGDGRAFLAGERFTAADLTFASLAAPSLLPKFDLEGVPRAFGEKVERLRSTRAGAHALRLLDEERDRVVGA